MAKKILLVDDDPNIVKVYEEKLKMEGYEVKVASSAAEGITFATEDRPHLVLLDVMLSGGMNGFDVLKYLKKDEKLKNIPVLMLTNLETEEKVATEMGVNDYLVKANTDLNVLVQKVKDTIK